MNKLEGQIVHIQTEGNLSLVSIKVGQDLLLKAIVIDTPDTATYLQKGSSVEALFKETEVLLSPGQPPPNSVQNRIEGRITHIEEGGLLSRVTLLAPMGELVCILSSGSCEGLGLKPGLPVTAQVQMNEIILSPC